MCNGAGLLAKMCTFQEVSPCNAADHACTPRRAAVKSDSRARTAVPSTHSVAEAPALVLGGHHNVHRARHVEQHRAEAGGGEHTRGACSVSTTAARKRVTELPSLLDRHPALNTRNRGRNRLPNPEAMKRAVPLLASMASEAAQGPTCVSRCRRHVTPKQTAGGLCGGGE